jgi:hypothetical protein
VIGIDAPIGEMPNDEFRMEIKGWTLARGATHSGSFPFTNRPKKPNPHRSPTRGPRRRRGIPRQAIEDVVQSALPRRVERTQGYQGPTAPLHRSATPATTPSGLHGAPHRWRCDLLRRRDARRRAGAILRRRSGGERSLVELQSLPSDDAPRGEAAAPLSAQTVSEIPSPSPPPAHIHPSAKRCNY